MKEKLVKILPFIGISLFIFIICKIGMPNIAKSFIGIDYAYSLIALFFIVPVLLLQTYKWFVITKKQKIGMSFSEAIKIQFISIFYGFVTPARIGSFIKIAYLQQKTKNLGRSSSSVVIDRVFDLFTVLALAGMGSLLLLENFSKITWTIAAVFCVFILAVFFFMRKNRSKIFLQFIYEKMLPQKFKAGARKSFHSFYDLIPSYGFMVISLMLNILSWIAVYSQIFFVAKALGISISYYALLAVLPISTLVSLLPITIAGLGTREASLITLLGLFSINAAKIVTMSLLSMAIANFIPAVFGFFFSIKGAKNKTK